jgi:hypothetical protein
VIRGVGALALPSRPRSGPADQAPLPSAPIPGWVLLRARRLGCIAGAGPRASNRAHRDHESEGVGTGDEHRPAESEVA